MDLQKNDKIEASVESLGYRGEGVARLGRVPVFVNGALPCERVRAHVLLVKKDYAVAKLEDVLLPSPDRVTPVCPYFGRCGGCNLQHLAYAAQLDYKRAAVSDALRKIGHIDAEVSPCVPSDKSYGYRNKLSLPVRRGKEGVAVGLFAYNSHRVVEIDDCPLQTDRICELIPGLRRLAARFEPYDEETGRGTLRHFVVRDLGGRISLAVVATRDIAGKLEAACEVESIAADELWLNINAARGNVIMGEQTRLISGSREFYEVLGMETSVHPKGFLQVNQSVADKLYGAVIAAAKKLAPDLIIDAYSGGGTLTALLADCAREVVGVEIEPAASASASELTARLGLTSVRNILGDCAVVLPELIRSAVCRADDTLPARDAEQKSSTDRRVLIVLDPPRGGCDRAVTDAVNASGADELLYVSCNPATLARDLALLNNYAPVSVTPFDLFPQTCHVETLVVLRTKSR